MRSAGAHRLLLMVVVVHQVAVAAPHDPAAACAAKAVTECVINRPMRNQQVDAAVRALEELTRGGQGLRAHSIWRARPLATNLTHIVTAPNVMSIISLCVLVQAHLGSTQAYQDSTQAHLGSTQAHLVSTMTMSMTLRCRCRSTYSIKCRCTFQHVV